MAKTLFEKMWDLNQIIYNENTTVKKRDKAKKKMEKLKRILEKKTGIIFYDDMEINNGKISSR